MFNFELSSVFLSECCNFNIKPNLLSYFKQITLVLLLPVTERKRCHNNVTQDVKKLGRDSFINIIFFNKPNLSPYRTIPFPNQTLKTIFSKTSQYKLKVRTYSSIEYFVEKNVQNSAGSFSIFLFWFKLFFSLFYNKPESFSFCLEKICLIWKNLFFLSHLWRGIQIITKMLYFI